MKLHVTLPGKPYPQPRARYSKFGLYYPTEHRQKVQETSIFLQQCAKLQNWEKATLPVQVSIITITKCPNRLKKQVVIKGKRLYKPTKPDIDNYAKYILDCCSKADIIWSDDSLVTVLVQKDFYGIPGEESSTQVIIETLQEYGDL
jgi:Holliday junction resolvase RusA-like endonuclease